MAILTTFAHALLSEKPAEHLADQMKIFAPLIGSWDLDIIYYAPDGGVQRAVRGEWHFAWALEGRAVADVWITPPRSERKAVDPPSGEYGLTLRFFDPAIDAWRSTWHGPVHGIVWPFIGRARGSDFVLERVDAEGALMHWTFSNISHERFDWRAEVSHDDGSTWRLEQQMRAQRQKDGPTSASPAVAADGL